MDLSAFFHGRTSLTGIRVDELKIKTPSHASRAREGVRGATLVRLVEVKTKTRR
jgi:hypothetical protein